MVCEAYSTSVSGPPIAQQKELKKIVRLGEDVKIQCPISGNPTPIIEWKKGGETIDYSFIRIRTKNKAMRIKKSQEDDTGIYICKGVNGFGNVEVRVDLIIIGNNFQHVFHTQIYLLRNIIPHLKYLF
jgi:hypothetical protein